MISKSSDGVFLRLLEDGTEEPLTRQSFAQERLNQGSSSSTLNLASTAKIPWLRISWTKDQVIQLELGSPSLGKFIGSSPSQPMVQINNTVYLLEEQTTRQILKNLQSLKVSLGTVSPVDVSILRANNISSHLIDEIGDLWAKDFLPPESGGLGLTGKPTMEILPYDYQTRGISYLVNMIQANRGCLLADAMGLGKTAQVIGCVFDLTNGGTDFASKKFLIVVPATLAKNWQREFHKFAPSINPYLHYGADRTALPSTLAKQSVVITTYDLLTYDSLLFQQLTWTVAFFDEAQAIKNPESLRTQGAKALRANVKIAVSGTPFENHLTDVWSIMDLVTPGLLGEKDIFRSRFSDSVSSARKISRIISPFLLRRTVEALPEDLPLKTEYQTLLEPDGNTVQIQREIMEELDSGKIGKLHAITRLLLAAAHAEMTDYETQNASSKANRLWEVLAEVYANGEKAIVFTPFRSVIDFLAQGHREKFPAASLYTVDGRTPMNSRQAIVDSFSQGLPGVCILNPAVGGAGLNITAANHVIHFSPLWNPSKRRQATARSFRNGQERPVFVHNFIYEQTIEQYVWDTQEKKDHLSSGVFEHSDSDFDIQTLRVLLGI